MCQPGNFAQINVLERNALWHSKCAIVYLHLHSLLPLTISSGTPSLMMAFKCLWTSEEADWPFDESGAEEFICVVSPRGVCMNLMIRCYDWIFSETSYWFDESTFPLNGGFRTVLPLAKVIWKHNCERINSLLHNSTICFVMKTFAEEKLPANK